VIRRTPSIFERQIVWDIELAFHPAKTCLRKAAERTIEGLHRWSDRSFGRSILLNAGGILGMQAMTHHDWDALV
jgi:hypothetical protein